MEPDMRQLHNRHEMKARRQDLRGEMPRAEVILWSSLQRRQHSVGSYVIDFYAPEVTLAIELDGDSHAWPGRVEHDAERDRILQSVGIHVVRIPNEEVFQNLEGVMECLARVIDERRAGKTPATRGEKRRRTPSNPPSERGGEEKSVIANGGEESSAPPAKGGLGGVLLPSPNDNSSATEGLPS
jgi:very-short-patch-repair endonuclease